MADHPGLAAAADPVLSVAITAVRALGISRGVFRYLERLATHDLALQAMANAREQVYRALAQGDPGYSVGLKRGALLSRTGDDIDEIGNALIRGVIPIVVGAITAVAAVVVMALVSLWAAMVLLVALVVSGAVAPWFAARGSARTIADSARATAESAEATITALWHAPELVIAGRRDAALAAAARADDDAIRAADRGLAPGRQGPPQPRRWRSGCRCWRPALSGSTSHPGCRGRWPGCRRRRDS